MMMAVKTTAAPMGRMIGAMIRPVQAMVEHAHSDRPRGGRQPVKQPGIRQRKRRCAGPADALQEGR